MRPAIFITRRTSGAPDARAPSAPSTSAVNIGFSSRGGPGSSSTTRPSSSIHSPGALPRVFSMTRAPAGTIACRRLISGIGIANPRAAKRARRCVGDRVVLSERPIECRRDRLPRHVIVGGTESAAEDHEVNATQRRRIEWRELLAVVADDGLRTRRRCRAC